MYPSNQTLLKTLETQQLKQKNNKKLKAKNSEAKNGKETTDLLLHSQYLL